VCQKLSKQTLVYTVIAKMKWCSFFYWNGMCDSYKREEKHDGGQLKIRLVQHISPPSVSNSGTRYACSLERTLMNFWKSATLLRVRNSSSLSLRSRGCPMFIRCSLCGHVIHPTVASSVTNTTSATIRSSSWTPLILNSHRAHPSFV